MIPGGGLHDLNAVAKHFYYEGQKSGNESQFPLIFMGAVTTAIGATMLFHGGQKLWADHVKAQAKAAKPHAERARRHEHHERER